MLPKLLVTLPAAVQVVRGDMPETCLAALHCSILAGQTRVTGVSPGTSSCQIKIQKIAQATERIHTQSTVPMALTRPADNLAAALFKKAAKLTKPSGKGSNTTAAAGNRSAADANKAKIQAGKPGAWARKGGAMAPRAAKRKVKAVQKATKLTEAQQQALDSALFSFAFNFHYLAVLKVMYILLLVVTLQQSSTQCARCLSYKAQTSSEIYSADAMAPPAEPESTPTAMIVDMRLIEAADRIAEGQGKGQVEDCMKETDYFALFRVRFEGCAALMCLQIKSEKYQGTLCTCSESTVRDFFFFFLFSVFLMRLQIKFETCQGPSARVLSPL